MASIDTDFLNYQTGFAQAASVARAWRRNNLTAIILDYSDLIHFLREDGAKFENKLSTKLILSVVGPIEEKSYTEEIL